jgi:hypothetical protein
MGLDRFFRSTVHLSSPSREEVEAAFTDLPRQGRALVACRLAELSDVLGYLEDAGFFGMRMRLGERTARVSAFKGKEGPCHDTGRSARYAGAAQAALDDDNHLLFGETRVCEKTAQIYASPVYSETVSVTGGDAALLAKLAGDPAAFDCDTFEEDARRLAASFGGAGEEGPPAVPIIYPGPFRLLVLPDGSILRRGLPTLVRSGLADDLAGKDGCVLLVGERARGAGPPESYAVEFGERGAAFLLGPAPVGAAFEAAGEPRMEALDHVTPGFAERLRRMIERKESYFILTGTDPGDRHGCCPSADVGEAERLVDSGVLGAWRPHSPPGSCPATVYAFAGEIGAGGADRPLGGAPGTAGSRPSFEPNTRLRKAVAERLGGDERGPSRLPVALARWSLLAFVAASVAFAFVRAGGEAGQGAYSGDAAAVFPGGRGVLVLFFHPSERCAACDEMERLARATLERHFAGETAEGLVAMRSVNLDSPVGRRMRERLGLYTSTLALVRVRDGREQGTEKLSEAWQVPGPEGSFVEKMKSALSRALGETAVKPPMPACRDANRGAGRDADGRR